ncbi:MAG: hypothetical protein JXB07_13400 [Anaerolineae bacterium]|nr:hypothetical protein [Anaerolineae bacterium]
MPRLVIPEGVTPADLFGGADLLPGQDWLVKETLLHYVRLMEEGRFPWQVMQEDQPIAIEAGTNGKVISQGHHRCARRLRSRSRIWYCDGG